MASIFFDIRELELNEAKFTGLEREMLALCLEANPGVSLGAALKDVFDYLGVKKVGQRRMEAICQRLINEHQDREQQTGSGSGRKQGGSSFGKELIDWINGMNAAARLLTAVGYDYAKAKDIYVNQDYLVTDTITSIFLQDRWNQALSQLQAAAAPWTGGKKNTPDEIIDLTDPANSDDGWRELARCFGPG